MIRPYLYDLINDHRIVRRAWKIQICKHVISFFQRYCRNKQGSHTDDVIREIFRSFLNNYQKELKIIKGSDFVFESVKLTNYKLYKVSLRRGGSYVKSPEWLLHKGATINLKTKYDDECFGWSTISALRYNEITKKRV